MKNLAVVRVSDVKVLSNIFFFVNFGQRIESEFISKLPAIQKNRTIFEIQEKRSSYQQLLTFYISHFN